MKLFSAHILWAVSALFYPQYYNLSCFEFRLNRVGGFTTKIPVVVLTKKCVFRRTYKSFKSMTRFHFRKVMFNKTVKNINDPD